MAEKESAGGSSIPWTTLLALVTVLGGAAVYLGPLSSDRPASTGTDAHVGTLGYQDVDARLWQDPLQAAFTAREAATQRNTQQIGADGYEITPLIRQRPSGLRASVRVTPVTQPAIDGPGHALDDLQDRMRQLAVMSAAVPEPATRETTQATTQPSGDSPDVLVLGVFVPSGLYGELVEQRLRIRVAVLEGLGVCGFQPDDDQHIGYFEIPWSWPQSDSSEKLWSQWKKDLDREKSLEAGAVATSEPPRLLVPYEWCLPKPPRMAGTNKCPNSRDAVVVLWLNLDEFSDLPLTRMACLIQSIKRALPQRQRHPDFKFIGPYDSTSLHAAVKEVDLGIDPDVKKVLAPVRLYAATPTAEDNMLLRDTAARCTLDKTNTSDKTGASDKSVNEFINNRIGSKVLFRTTLTDDVMCSDLVDELRLRGLSICCRPGEKEDTAFKHAGDLNHIALIAEWDTFYGRALSLSFTAALFDDKDHPDNAKQLQCDICEQNAYPDWVHPFVYLRGIDGNAPAPGKPADMPEKPGAAPSSDKSAPMSRQDAADKPEGTNQTDYLRRLADQLADTDERLRRTTGQGIAAVGVLGTDIYDTLLVLRAVRPKLTNAVYFTTNLDARFSMRSEWQATHNLIVVSPFGLSLHPYYQSNIPPFRDSNQTAIFAAVLTAMGRIQTPGDIICGTNRANTDHDRLPARRFEISRRGPWELTVDHDNPGRLKPAFLGPERSRPESGPDPALETELAASGVGGMPAPLTIHPSRWDLLPWLYGGWELVLCLALLIVPFCAWLYYVGAGQASATEPFKRPDGTDGRRISEACAHSLPWAAAILVLGSSPFFGSFLAWAGGPSGEPMTFIAGISSWPAEALRLTAFALSVCFIIRAHSDLARNDDRIKAEFNLGDCPEPSAHQKLSWGRFRDEIRTAKLRGWHVYIPNNASVDRIAGRDVEGTKAKAWPQNDDCVCVQDLWCEYTRRSRFGRRYLRIAIPCALCLVAYLAVPHVLGAARAPARGPLARDADDFCRWMGMIGWTILTMMVLDGALLNIQFINHLIRAGTKWSDDVLAKWDIFGLGEHRQDLTWYLDIRIIAMRTKVVGAHIYYPFLIIALLIAARSSLFDDWPWTTSLFILVVLSLGITFFGAWYLRRAAEHARQESLEKLQKRRKEAAASAQPRSGRPLVDCLDDMIKEVENEKEGAFAVLSQYPTLSAILLPSGGLGLWALIEYLVKGIA